MERTDFLMPLGTVEIPALVTPFRVEDHFQADHEIALGIRIASMDLFFQRLFLGLLIEPHPGVKLRHSSLIGTTPVETLIYVLGGVTKPEVSLWAIWSLMIQDSATLTGSGCPNIFHCRAVDGLVHPAGAVESSAGWRLYGIDQLVGNWVSRSRVFEPNAPLLATSGGAVLYFANSFVILKLRITIQI